MKNFKIKQNNQEINRQNSQSNSGFSMIETLVAIFILLVAVTGPMVFAQNALRSAFYARDQITAFYLAQDAIEYVKNRRDHYMLKGAGTGDASRWLTGLDECETEDGCTIDTVSNNGEGEVRSCASGIEPGCLGSSPEDDSHLLIDSQGYFGFYSAGYDSLFSREIYINEIDAGKEAEIVVRIRWSSHGTIGYREITVVENFYNWPNALGI